MKETRAVVLGLVVVALIALVWSFFRRPARGMRRVRSFHVEVHSRDEGRQANVSVRIPGFLAGKAIEMATDALGRDFDEWRFEDGDEHRVTPREILDAADRSEPGKPTAIDLGPHDAALEVSREGDTIRIVVTEHHGRRRTEITVPRTVVEGLSQSDRLSARELLARIDDLGPGEIVSIKTDDAEIRITAEPR
jgi:hypothetical protein